jgi:hypothetical protein
VALRHTPLAPFIIHADRPERAMITPYSLSPDCALPPLASDLWQRRHPKWKCALLGVSMGVSETTNLLSSGRNNLARVN